MKVIKRTVLVCFALLLAQSISADGSEKALKQESKKAAAQMKSEGWSVFGKSLTLREAMDTHYKKLGEGRGSLMSIEGHGIANDINLAIRKSQYNAAIRYASMQETKVEGEVHTNISNSEGDKASSSVKMDASFKSSTEQIVKSLTPSAIFYRTTKDGKTEVRSFYIVKAL